MAPRPVLDDGETIRDRTSERLFVAEAAQMQKSASQNSAPVRARSDGRYRDGLVPVRLAGPLPGRGCGRRSQRFSAPENACLLASSGMPGRWPGHCRRLSGDPYFDVQNVLERVSL